MAPTQDKTPTLFAGPTEQLSRLIDWKLGSTQQLRRYKTDTIARGAHMQRQFTIELRVDYADNEKNQAMRIACQQAAQHIFATANLLKDGQKPQVAVFSDDFYSGREEIELISNTIQSGLDAIGGDAAAPVSNELLAAFGDADAVQA